LNSVAHDDERRSAGFALTVAPATSYDEAYVDSIRSEGS